MVQISVDKTYITRLPLPQPNEQEILENENFKRIAVDALKLQLYNDTHGDFKALAAEFGIEQPDLPQTPKLYDELRAQLDIRIAQLYGLSREEMMGILESFKVLQKKNAKYCALLKNEKWWS